MTFSIPKVDQLGWGEPLQNHLSQLNEPTTGGLIHVENITERDSRFWPNGATDKDEYANKTVYVTSTGTFHVWTISTDPNNTRYWRELQKTSGADGWLTGTGTVEGYGYELRGTGTNFNALEKYTQIRVTTPNGEKSILTVDTITNSTTLRTTYYAIYASVMGGGFWNKNGFEHNNASVSGNTVTWTNLAAIGVKVGDVYSQYVENIADVGRIGIIVAINGNTATVDWVVNTYTGNSPFWYLSRAVPTGSTYETQSVSQIYNNGEKDNTIFYPDGTMVNYGQLAAFGDKGTNLEGSSAVLKQGGTLSLTRIIDGVTRGVLFIGANGNGFVDPALPGDAYIMAHGARGQKISLRTILGDIDFVTANEQTNTPDVKITTGANAGLRRMGIGTGNTAPSEKLHVVGNILATGTITPGSDLRWKKDITSIESPLELINDLNGVHYKWNKDHPGNELSNEKDLGVHIGLIAQDALNIPGAVKEDNEGFLHLDYMGLVGLLVEGNKALQNKVESLEERIIALENK